MNAELKTFANWPSRLPIVICEHKGRFRGDATLPGARYLPGAVLFGVAAVLITWDFLIKLRPLYPRLAERCRAHALCHRCRNLGVMLPLPLPKNRERRSGAEPAHSRTIEYPVSLPFG